MGFSYIGGLKFHFKQGDTAPITLTDNALYPVKFPEGTGGLSLSVDTVDNEEPSAGILGITDSVVTKSTMEYTLTLKSFDLNILSFLLGGSTPTTNTPPTSIAVGTDLAHSGWGYMEWYRNGDVSGTPSRKHHGFTCQVIPDGEFSLDPTKFTEVKFKIKITGTRGTFL